MITYTEFFLFFIWVIALILCGHYRQESIKAKKILMVLLENDDAREKMVQDFKFFKKSIIRGV